MCVKRGLLKYMIIGYVQDESIVQLDSKIVHATLIESSRARLYLSKYLTIVTPSPLRGIFRLGQVQLRFQNEKIIDKLQMDLLFHLFSNGEKNNRA